MHVLYNSDMKTVGISEMLQLGSHEALAQRCLSNSVLENQFTKGLAKDDYFQVYKCSVTV